MKLRIVTVSLELSRRQKALSLAAIAAFSAFGVAVATAEVPHQFVPNELLTADDLNENFEDLDTKVEDLDARLTAAEMDGPVWASYTPTITSNGSTPASSFVRGGTIRYVRIGSTVCLQGQVVIGEQSSGAGGTFIKVSLPPGLPGATGETQTGIGTVARSGDSTTLFWDGSGAIETDVNNVILAKQSSYYFVDGDARPGAGILWTASGCYETN